MAVAVIRYGRQNNLQSERSQVARKRTWPAESKPRAVHSLARLRLDLTKRKEGRERRLHKEKCPDKRLVSTGAECTLKYAYGKDCEHDGHEYEPF